MARIYFIYTNISSVYSTDRFHFGIASISSVLKQNGHKTRLFSIGEYKQIKSIFKELEEFRPDVVAFSAISTQFKHVQRITSEIKKSFDIMTICGGIHTTLVPDCLEESEGLDAIVMGEGEYPLLELANAIDSGEDRLDLKNFWFKKNGEIIKNELRPLISDLDVLPFVDRELFAQQNIIDTAGGLAGFMFSRGCPFKCTYCCNHTLSRLYQGKGKYVRFRGIESALAEIEDVTQKYRVTQLAFGDDTFTADTKWVIGFLAEYKKRFNYPFKCQVRPGTCSRETFQLLKEAGCYLVAIGIESGNPYILNEVMKRTFTIEQIEETFRNAHEAGLKTIAGNILGIPGEDVGTIKDTINLNIKINPTSSVAGLFYPYIGTDLRKLCEEKGFKIKDVSDKFVERRDVAVELPTIKTNDLLYYARNFRYLVHKGNSPRKALYFKVYDNPNLLLVRMLLRIIRVFIPSRLRRKILAD
ncbi:B12-binding domain-containing radical SAM protein [Chloroflexota bacterium]